MPEVIVGAPADSFDVLPVADEAYRGKDVFIPQGAGIADVRAFCRKNVDDNLEWFAFGDRVQWVLSGGSTTLTDMTAADAPLGDQQFLDLTDFMEVRICGVVKTAGETGRVRVDYTADNSTYAVLTTNFISLAATGVIHTDWEPIPALARAPVGLQAIAYNGDESEDPVLFGCLVEVRR